MPTQREYLEQDLAKSLKEFGPDSASVKHLKAQIASLGTVRHPSQLAALNSSENDKYHGATLQSRDSAPQDPMLPAMNGLEDAMLQMASQYTGKPVQDQSQPKASTTPAPKESN